LLPSTIPEVLTRLDEIIAWCRKHDNRMGYFAMLYHRMTKAVLEGIENGSFQDGPRMQRLDIIFANRYLKAWKAYTSNQACSRSWQKAFDSCRNDKLTVIQHLLLGINTHINLDLGIAAAETSPGEAIHDLEQDFRKINQLIAALSNGIQESLSNIWFPLKTLSRLSDGREDAVINFSISKAREVSWTNAVALSLVEGTDRDNYIGIIDDSVVLLADRVINPGIAFRLLLHPVRVMEPRDVSEIIDLLAKAPAAGHKNMI
jgi:hypothetical protein